MKIPYQIMLFCVLGAAAQAAPITYTLNNQSIVDVRVFKDGVASGLAHDHVMRATDVRGEVRYDPETKALTAVRIEVMAESLEVDPPRIRHLYGIEGTIDADDRAEVGKNMRAQDQLNVAEHPKMTFESKEIITVPDGRTQLKGTLTLRGQSRDVVLPVAIWANGERLEGKGELRIRHTDFGFQPYSALGGAIRNQDRIDLVIKVRADAPKALPAPAVP